MAILHIAAEDIDFPLGAALTGVQASSSYYRTGYARCALWHNNSANNIATKSNAFVGGAVTSCWLHARLYVGSNNTSKKYIGLGKSGTMYGLYIGSDSGTDNKVALWKSDGVTDTKLATETGTTLVPSQVLQVDMQVTNYGGSATVKIYIEGNEVLSFTGDVTVGANADLDAIFLSGQTASGGVYSSEHIVADEDTRLFSVVTLVPNGAGDTNDWDSGDQDDIDEAELDDGDFAQHDTVDEVLQTTLSDTPAGTFTVKAAKVSARCSKSAGATPTKIKLGIRSGGTDDHGSAQTTSTSWETFERLMTTNPVTAGNWTTSELDALQLSLKTAA